MNKIIVAPIVKERMSKDRSAIKDFVKPDVVFEPLDLLNMNQFNDFPYYVIDDNDWVECFYTPVEVIATFRTHEQLIFNMLVEHKIDHTSSDIEKNYLVTALNRIGDLKVELWKLSTCTYHIDELRAKERDNVKQFIRRKNGKFFFYPHMRDEVENQQCLKDPDLASSLL